MGGSVIVLDLGPIGARVVALGIGRGAEHGDDVEEFAAPQRVVHDVEAGAGPQDDLVAAHVLGHLAPSG